MTNRATNRLPSDENQPLFARLLAEVGVTETHGLGLLRLIKMCNGAYDHIVGEQMRQQTISSPQWRLLAQLFVADHGENKSLTPTELARSQRLSKNTVSAHLRSLEEQGLILRQIDPDDLRAFRILLSEEGRQLIRHSLPTHIGFLNNLAAGLAPAEIAQLEILLEKLHRSLLDCGKNHSGTATNKHE